MRKILLSIKPVFAEQIIRGEKRVELRRRAKIMMGDVIFLYASSPAKKIVGEFVAGRTYYVREEEALEMVRTRADLGLDLRDKPYVVGGKYIQVIPIVFPRQYKRHINLSEIRKILPDYKPPVSYSILERNNKITDILERNRCETEPVARFIVFGIENCIFCKKNVSFLKSLFGSNCVTYCDLHSRECFVEYRSINEHILNNEKGVPLTLGRYGNTFIVIKGGVNIYDLEKIYTNINGKKREVLIYRQGFVSTKKVLSEDIEKLFNDIFG